MICSHRTGEIDSLRFPNFAELASISTWFPNGYTVYDSTFKAVPAILDAKLPKRGSAPDVRSHKPSVYHLVDRLGYRVFKVESATAVCPPDICPRHPNPAPGRAEAPRGPRPAGAPAQVDRRNPPPAAPGLLHPPRSAPA